MFRIAWASSKKINGPMRGAGQSVPPRRPGGGFEHAAMGKPVAPARQMENQRGTCFFA
jgi:hypothetical protein